MVDALDAAAIRRWSRSSVDLLASHCAEIDALNVYPVPDADTGSNLLATLRAADAALTAAEPDTAGGALAALAAGAAQGALGNSGFIVSQILRGLADATRAELDADALSAGLVDGARLGREAVVEPLDGTILSVARAAAEAAHGDTLADRLQAALTAAEAALARTPDELEVLGKAGVVDAGGRGLVVLLAALCSTATGEAVELARVRVPNPMAERPRETGAAEFGFEVQYLLDAPAEAMDELRAGLASLGDSVAVVPVGDQAHEVWKVHVHVNDVGAAIEAGLEAGRPRRISVVRFSDQIAESEASSVVAVAPGAGLAHLFEAEGVRVVESATDRPATAADVTAAILATGAREVVVLPNVSQLTGIAEQAAELARGDGIRVAVVPMRSPVQGLAAIAVHDPGRRFDDDVIAMAEAAAATRYAELVIAADEALTAVGICQPGDVLGLIDGEVVEIGRGLPAVVFNVVDRLLGVGAELITVLTGATGPARIGELVEAHVRGRSPLTDVVVYAGGQTDQPVIIGVE